MIRMKLVVLTLLALLSAVGWAQAQPKIELALDQTTGAPGSSVSGKVTVTFASGLHGYQNPPTESWMRPVKITGDALLDAEYPKGKMKITGGLDQPAAIYEGAVTIPIRLELPDAPGEHQLSLKVDYQQCDEETCFPPRSKTISAAVTVQASATPTETPAQPTEGKAAPEPQPTPTPSMPPDAQVVKEQPTPTTPTAPTTEAKPTPEPVPASETAQQPAATSSPTPAPAKGGLDGFLAGVLSGDNPVLTILAMVLVGLALCVTPCVYPMIPITVSYFSSQSAENRAARLGMGAMYMIGIAITYGVVGGIFASLGGAVGQLFTQPWFLFALAALMVGLGLSLFGVYEFGVPSFIGKHLKSRSGPVGALVMGLLMGFAAAPCAGALVGAVAVKVAEVGSLGYGVMVFTAIGVGLGLPFLVLASLSAGAKALPKSGGWLAAVKPILGLVVFAVGFDYLTKGLGLRVGTPELAWAWTGFFAAGALYLLLFERKSGESRLVFGIKGTALLVLGVLVGGALAGTQPQVASAEVGWVKFDEAAFEQAKASGKPIIVDGTADWCAECQVINRTVFETPEGRELLASATLLKIDWSTGVDPEYQKRTAERFNIVGLPHIVFFKPGGEEHKTVKSLHSTAELRDLLRGAGAKL